MKRRVEEILSEVVKFLDEEENYEDSHGVESSFDAQVDRRLIELEKRASNSKDGKKKNEFESFSRHDGVVSSFLFEEPEGDDEEDQGEDSEMDEEPSKLPIESIDVASFANDVVRLIENFDKLIEIRDTVVERAKSFLGKDYDEDVIKSFIDSLHEDHGIVVGKSRYEQEYEIQPPKAGLAGPYGS